MGGTSGGGGSSGRVEYPPYLQAAHSDWLNKGDGTSGTDTIETSMVAAMNAALGSSPFTSYTGYDPTSDFADAEVTLDAFQSLDLPTLFSNALGQLPLIAVAIDAIVDADSRITAVVSAYSDMLDAEIDTKILPKFRRGMQDINAVQLSTFVIGEALILAEQTRDVAKFDADLRLRAYDQRNNMIFNMGELQIKSIGAWINYYQVVTHYGIEFARMKFVAMKEYTSAILDVEEKDAEWDLRVYQHGANLLAAISGASATVNKQNNSGASALGGALSGAASGAMAGSAAGPWGTVIGGVVGAIGGAVMSS